MTVIGWPAISISSFCSVLVMRSDDVENPVDFLLHRQNLSEASAEHALFHHAALPMNCVSTPAFAV